MLLLLLLTTIFLTSVWICRWIWYERFIKFAQFPQLPPSLLWGHLRIYHEVMQSGSLDRDHDHIFSQIHESLGRPPIVLFDYRPICRPVLVIANHEVGEQISRSSKQFRSSVPKLGLSFLEPVIGHTSILSAEGEKWKALRKTFNPWFSLQHLMSLMPSILGKIEIFVTQLDALSVSGDEVSLVTLTTNLMYDIIGNAIFDIDMDAQHLEPGHQGELVRAFNDLINAYWDDKIHLPWFFTPVNALKRRRLGNRVHRIMKSIVRRKHEEHLWRQQQQRRTNGYEKRPQPQLPPSITLLSLQETTHTGGILTPELLDQTCDQLRTFLLGGHDSPSATLAWAFYELSRTPRAQAAVHAELDGLFGPGRDAAAVRTALASPTEGPDLLRRMVYVEAVLKETLRLHPPASTARYSPKGSGFVVRLPTTGEELCLDDLILYNCSAIMHHDRGVFGSTANQFMPERWLMAEDEKNTNQRTIPPSAWRPYERGPRACIGQEFARITMRVVLAVVARQYEFIKVGIGALARDASTGLPILRPDGRYEVDSQVYTTRQITARPVDGLKVKVKRVRT
ncbi:hypothetical protein CBS63078_3259 [Aspergillus niger]|uniref:Lipase (Class 3) family protein n=2 Tax=Aspergillus niger TaxID=5061 RepID=A0A3F3RNJ8_ASPNG|nr:cytochrome P450 monooxygenase [Aspergillus niger CBS 513.88]XP_025459445.1 cytochrome P450 monooxygenase [Aspergillus niger CBS 101883]KAI2823576.1 hypothetical protein CBS115989_1165 [Aspergillus niger]KAI2839032.1 hypothetical protein CBS11350_7736 [Aspergillus niger]KAI2858597.1 hypothetical protein CBS11232_2363 [Aspergillus niger]KAI2866343.1 hypothetical protein CBS12448_1451 [Aspergillus niger]KAI2879684.1 hypothetical protein CBS115988_2220 [Aspergillus niger]|eukprot:XP_001397902.2 cytochrome P450 monooxygenase [Aspergillus niger CBS 513.88]